MSKEQISYSSPFPGVLAIDGEDRVREFLARHGSAAPDVMHEGDHHEGVSGWSSVHAADGYRLHCEWSVLGSARKMSFVEIAPASNQSRLAAPMAFASHAETVTPGEDEVNQALAETCRSVVKKVHDDSGHAHRAVHAKSHAILQCELEVHADLAPELAQGIFQVPRRYQAIVRISTISGDILNDNVSLPRGFAIKVFGVEGDRLAGSEGCRTQDFVMASGTEFPTADLKAFLTTLKRLASTTDRAEWAKSALSALLRPIVRAEEKLGLHGGGLKAVGGYPESNPLGERYGSQAAYRFGDYVAKLDLVPMSANFLALTDREFDLDGRENAIRDEISAAIAQEGGAWTLRAQLCRDAIANPIEDASVAWAEEGNPYLPIATLTVRPQAAWSTERSQAVDDRMAFSPWHGISAHQPLGVIGRARKVVYPLLSEYRGTLNRCPVRDDDSVGSCERAPL